MAATTDTRLKHLTFDAKFKALDDTEPPGTFEAIVAVFGTVDRHGEVIEPGFFIDSLAQGFPTVTYSHDWLTPPIGVTMESHEIPEGLYAKGRLFVAEGEDSPVARQVWTALKAVGGDGRPALREWSVGLNIQSERYEEVDGRQVTVLEKGTCVEYGPCIKGVNPDTYTIAAKAEDIQRAIESGALPVDELRAALDAMSEKAALPVTRLPMAPLDTAWDNNGAKGRVHAWAQHDDSTFDASRLAKAYLWRDDGAPVGQVTSYRFIVTDMIGGALTYIPKAIFAAANVLQGGRGGTTVSDAGQAALRKAVEQLYARMRTEFSDDTITVPWSSKAEQPEGDQPGDVPDPGEGNGSNTEWRRDITALFA